MNRSQTIPLLPPVQETAWACEKNLRVDSNDDFSVEFLGQSMDGDLATFRYEVRQIRTANTPWYWVLSLCQMTGLAEGKSIQDFVVGATQDGVPVSFSNEEVQGQAFLGLDPATQLTGLRFCNPGDAGARYAVTFNTSVLEEGCMPGTGGVLAAATTRTPAIRSDNAALPGYLFVPGPVCTCLPPMKTCEAAFAVAAGRAEDFGEFQFAEGGHNGWEWTNGPFEEGVHELELRVLRDPRHPDQQILVGMLYLFYRAGMATLTHDMDDNYRLEAVELYVGSGPLPRDAPGNVSAVSARFPYREDDLGGVGDHTLVVYDLSGPIYVVAHAVVSWQE